jgi:hypothetical protein
MYLQARLICEKYLFFPCGLTYSVPYDMEQNNLTTLSNRPYFKAELHFDLIILLDEWGYPPIDRNEVYKEIFEQAENFKKNS